MHKLAEIVSGWFTPAPGPASLLDLIAAIGLVIWTIAGLFLYYRRRQVFAGNGALIGMATRFGGYPILIGFLGLFLIVCRYFQVYFVDMRILLYLDILAAVAFVAFILYYLRVRYPKRVAEVRAHELRRKYAPERRPKRRGRQG